MHKKKASQNLGLNIPRGGGLETQMFGFEHLLKRSRSQYNAPLIFVRLPMLALYLCGRPHDD